jgi:capsular polysaccharide biosynthesis protein
VIFWRPRKWTVSLTSSRFVSRFFNAYGDGSGVGIVKNGIVGHPNGYIFSPDKTLILDVSTNHVMLERIGSPRYHPALLKTAIVKKRTLTGNVAVATAISANHNYYHWMFDLVSRIHLIQQTGMHVDTWIINHNHLEFQLETLHILGIDISTVMIPTRKTLIQAENLIVPTYISHPLPAWIPNIVAPIYCQCTDPPNKRIYISRAKASNRHIGNEEELLIILKKHDFETVFLEGLSVRRQAELFQNAEAIIAPHGAGLTNLIFCKDSILLLEILPHFPWNNSHFFERISEIKGINRKPIFATTSEQLENNFNFILSQENLKSIATALARLGGKVRNHECP